MGIQYFGLKILKTYTQTVACHDVIDGRVKTKEYTHEELRLMHAEGILRTQKIWRDEGFDECATTGIFTHSTTRCAG